jgi:hypothetical protein
MITETIYLDRQNIIELLFKARRPSEMDTALQDISATTRMILYVDGQTVDSQSVPEAFDWVSDGANGKLYLDLGGQSLRVGLFKARLVIYNAIVPKGKTWGYFLLNVKEG